MTQLNKAPLKADLAKARILDWIRDGKLGPGDRLQSERVLAERLSINTRTVRRGLAELEAEGVIEKRPRAGNFVRAATRRDIATSIAVAFPSYCRDDHGNHPTVGSVLTGVSEVFDQRDHAVSTYWYNPGRFWVDAGQAIVESGAAGLLLFPHGSLVREDIERLQKHKIEMALLAKSSCRFLDEMPIPGVEQDRISALMQGMDRAIAAGHRRIAVGCYTSVHDREVMLAVLRRYCRKHPEIGPMRDLVFDLPNEDRLDVSILPLLLERRVRPTAVVVPDEVVAGELFRLCYRLSLRVPDDLSIIALLDNSPGAHPVRLVAARGSIAMVQSGQVAAKILKQRLEKRVVDLVTRTIPLDIQDGESLGPPPNAPRPASLTLKEDI